MHPSVEGENAPAQQLFGLICGYNEEHMVTVCWFTFRIHEDATAEDRRKKLYEIAEILTGVKPGAGKTNVWKESTSFGLLNSIYTAKSTAQSLASALKKDRDLLLVRALSSTGSYEPPRVSWRLFGLSHTAAATVGLTSCR